MNRKADLRKQLLLIRRNLSNSYCEDASSKICRHLWQIDEFSTAQNILFYIPIRNEVDVTQAIEQTWEKGKKTFLPVVQKETQEMICVQFQDWSALTPGAYGILEPRDHHRAVDPQQIDVVIIPGVAFDLQGYRLGYGGGYYDRFLARYPDLVRIGVAYPEQMVPTVYPEIHDQPVDILVTSEKIDDRKKKKRETKR